jgi:hypothetical protein
LDASLQPVCQLKEMSVWISWDIIQIHLEEKILFNAKQTQVYFDLCLDLHVSLILLLICCCSKVYYMFQTLKEQLLEASRAKFKLS